tara:strand:+ start:203 stop:667 length:465 start_codon:yes stop_codon:yes gene_type:complete
MDYYVIKELIIYFIIFLFSLIILFSLLKYFNVFKEGLENSENNIINENIESNPISEPTIIENDDTSNSNSGNTYIKQVSTNKLEDLERKSENNLREISNLKKELDKSKNLNDRVIKLEKDTKQNKSTIEDVDKNITNSTNNIKKELKNNDDDDY